MEVTLGSGRGVRPFSVHPDSYAFELTMPVLSALEGIALAQALRLVVRAIQTAASA